MSIVWLEVRHGFDSNRRGQASLGEGMGRESEAGYEFLSHTADLKVRAWGMSLAATFGACADGLREAMCGDMRAAARIRRSIRVEGRDHEALLYNFVEEFLYLLDAEGFIFSKVDGIDISEDALTAEVAGDSAMNYEFANAVKAVTYSEMIVRDEGERWVAEFVLDV